MVKGVKYKIFQYLLQKNVKPFMYILLFVELYLKTHSIDYLMVISGGWLNDVRKSPFVRFGSFYVWLPQGKICNESLAGT